MTSLEVTYFLALPVLFGALAVDMCRTFRRDAASAFIVKRGKKGILAVVTACNCCELDNMFCTELCFKHNFLLERSVL